MFHQVTYFKFSSWFIIGRTPPQYKIKVTHLQFHSHIENLSVLFHHLHWCVDFHKPGKAFDIAVTLMGEGLQPCKMCYMKVNTYRKAVFDEKLLKLEMCCQIVEMGCYLNLR